MRSERDKAEATENRRRHGVDFTDAIQILRDPHRLEEVDDRPDCGEERTIVIGMAVGRVLVVVTSDRGPDTCRIISARKATRHEEDHHYAADREAW